MKRTCLLLALFPTLVLAEQTGFIEDSHVTTTLRMDYIDLHSNGFGSEAIGFSDYDMGTWAQSVKVAYASGFFLDHFGLPRVMHGIIIMTKSMHLASNIFMMWVVILLLVSMHAVDFSIINKTP